MSDDEAARQPNHRDLTPKAKASRRMDGLEINGGTALRGDIVISGAKCGLAVAMSWLDGQRAIGAGKYA